MVPPRGGVLGEILLERADGGLLDVVRRGEVGLAGAEIHHVHASRAQASASAATFMVEETLMLKMRSAIAVAAASML